MSLFIRLMIGFILLTLICWGSASLSAWYQTREKINELFDTQQMLFAKRLLTLDVASLNGNAATLPKSKTLLRHHRGQLEDDALAFAIFSRDGRMLLNDGDNGKALIFNPDYNGFTDGQLQDDDDRWHLLWLTSPDQRVRVVVGQEGEYRDDMTAQLVKSSVIPWLIALPLMLLMLLGLIAYELLPLKKLARQLRQRVPDDATPLLTSRLPKEIRPLVEALNGLFSRITLMLQRERRFISDAAHELRSPLAALRVQSEVVQLADDDDEMRRRALQQLDAGIIRATRLVDQLLTLSRVEADDKRKTFQPVALNRLVQEVVLQQSASARQANIMLRPHTEAEPMMTGHPLLLSLLVRNLLENAIRYTPSGSKVDITLRAHSLQIADNGPGVSEDDLARLGERFWRPPGQEKSGSGLGLSIVRDVAQLHGMQVQFRNRSGGGFCVALHW